MRFALLLAFVSSVFLTTDYADARPGAAQKTQTSKRQKKKPAMRVKAPAKAKATARKPSKVAKVDREDDEEAAAAEDAPPAKEEIKAPRRTGASVSQIVDDEVPRNEPKKR